MLLNRKDIEKRATAKWQSAGCPEGNSEMFWLDAENELIAEQDRMRIAALQTQRENEQRIKDENEKSAIVFMLSFGTGVLSSAFLSLFALLVLLTKTSFKLSENDTFVAIMIFGISFAIGMWSFVGGCIKLYFRNKVDILTQMRR